MAREHLFWPCARTGNCGHAEAAVKAVARSDERVFSEAGLAVLLPGSNAVDKQWRQDLTQGSELTDVDQRNVALLYILEAWEEAVRDGIEPEMMANASLFAAISDLVTIYGEDAVMGMVAGLAQRVERGEFTLNKRLQ